MKNQVYTWHPVGCTVSLHNIFKNIFHNVYLSLHIFHDQCSEAICVMNITITSDVFVFTGFQTFNMIYNFHITVAHGSFAIEVDT